MRAYLLINITFRNWLMLRNRLSLTAPILLDKNKLLLEQNNKKSIRLSMRSTVGGNTRIITHDELDKVQRKRDVIATLPTKRKERMSHASETCDWWTDKITCRRIGTGHVYD